MRSYLHNPNSAELVHFLFTPLSLLVEASNDPRFDIHDLVGKVSDEFDVKNLKAHTLVNLNTKFMCSAVGPGFPCVAVVEVVRFFCGSVIVFT